MGKGSHPRPFTDRDKFEKNWDNIDWGHKTPKKQEKRDADKDKE